MSPQRSGGLGYWHAGGGVETRAGPIPLQRAVSLCGFYLDEGFAAAWQGDLGGAAFCFQTAQEIATAAYECEAWRRSAAR